MEFFFYIYNIIIVFFSISWPSFLLLSAVTSRTQILIFFALKKALPLSGYPHRLQSREEKR